MVNQNVWFAKPSSQLPPRIDPFRTSDLRLGFHLAQVAPVNLRTIDLGLSLEFALVVFKRRHPQ
jgi:hypothetical protein